ncbi:MAG: hypothetical protein JXR81_02030, partial [Candidatus Goldbacteria bacterium]|nr:hypothetical protein [Candidatus Goldiibacteriota bacterium]
MKKNGLLARALVLSGVIIFLALSATVFAVFSAWRQKDVLRLSPAEISVTTDSGLSAELKTLETKSVSFAFDRDTTTQYTAYGASVITAAFENEQNLNFIKVFGAAPYTMTVAVEKGNNNWVDVSDLINMDLSSLAAQWNRFNAGSAAKGTRFMITLKPKKSLLSSGLVEIEFWGDSERINIKSSEDLLKMMEETDPPMQARSFAALPVQGEVTVIYGTDGMASTDCVFSAAAVRAPADMKRAWLTYEIYGFSHWITAKRAINGKAMQGGWPLAGAEEWSKQSEEINPEWLKKGANEIRFSLPAGYSTGYKVRNVKITAELDNGANMVENTICGETGIPDILDGNPMTGWEPYSQSEAAELNIDLNKPAQIERIGINIANKLYGKFEISGKIGDKWQNLSGMLDASAMNTGWHMLKINNVKPVEKIKINFNGGKEEKSGKISEITVIGSGSGAARSKDINITYPNAGQFYGRAAYIRGYLSVPSNASGPAMILAGPIPAEVRDGSFSAVVSKEDVGLTDSPDIDPWEVVITAIYPDGERLTKTVKLNRQLSNLTPPDGSDPSTYAFGLKPGVSRTINYEGALLEIGADAGIDPMNIRMTTLKDGDLPALEPGMTNVTGGHKGFRFLPHGAHFNSKVKIKLPYDRKLIPAGHTEDEVRTFYFDENLSKWLPVEFEAVDVSTTAVSSLTDHFTDFINATITEPDHPQAVSFNPNQIKDIKAADPGAGINLIEPPSANNKGSANLNYPIEIPPGRQGMQPQISINYSSDGGSGLLGAGWDMPVRSIVCETRWGVPRYSATHETETYLLEGEMLSPVAHRSDFVPRDNDVANGGKIFHTRVEGQFRKIQRKGTNPADYTWEVIEKDGTKNIYGDPTNTSGNSYALRSGNGVFMWVLKETVDTNGNNIRYYYSRFSNDGDLYLSSIRYTGDSAGDGAYKVEFIYPESNRVDTRIDARGGFKRVSSKLLSEITVSKIGGVDAGVIRKYLFGYEEGQFHKVLLKTITQTAGDGAVFQDNVHTFEYYDDIGSGTILNDSGADWSVPGDAVDNINIAGISILGESSMLSGTKGDGWGGHLYLGVAVPYQGKNISAGYKVGFSNDNSYGVLSLMDIDGDNLPDKVFKDRSSGKFKWRKNISGACLGASNAFSNTVDEINGLNSIAKDYSIMTSKGPEAYVSGVQALYNDSDGMTVGEKYMIDANSDGIPDLVDGGPVKFGKRMPDGSIIFADDTSYTDYPLGAGEAIDTEGLIPDFTEKYLKDVADFPLVDTIKRWVAPYDGVISISSTARMMPVVDDPLTTDKDELEEFIGYKDKDGVFVSVQKNGVRLLSESLQAEDTTGKTLSVDMLQVSKGDRIYFRVQSVFDGMYDKAGWDPEIRYINVEEFKDVNNLGVYSYKSSDDFVMAGRKGISLKMPFKGTVQLKGNLYKNGVTTDDVALVIKNGGVLLNNPDTDVISWDGTGSITMGNGGIRTFNVEKGDELVLCAKVDSNIDLKQLSWHPEIIYTETLKSSDEDVVPPALNNMGEYYIKRFCPYDIEFYSDNGKTAPHEPFKITRPELVLAEVPAPVEQDAKVYLRLTGNVTKNAAAADDVLLQVLVNDNVVMTKIIEGGYLGDVVVEEEIDAKSNSIEAGAKIRVKMVTGSQNDLDNIQWQPELNFKVVVPADKPGDAPEITLTEPSMKPAYEIDLLTDTDSDTASVDKTRIKNLTIVPVIIGKDAVDDKLIFTIKPRGKRLYKQEIALKDGIDTGNAVVMEVTLGEELFFEFTSRVDGIRGKVADLHVDGYYGEENLMPKFGIDSALLTYVNPALFQSPYRGWGVAGLNGNPSGDITVDNVKSLNTPINESDLIIPADLKKPESSNPEDNVGDAEEIDQIVFYPELGGIADGTNDAWSGSDKMIFAKASVLSSSRNGTKNVSMPSADDFAGTAGTGSGNGAGAYGVQRMSLSRQNCVGAGVFFVNGSYSTGDSWALLDYMDMNGDRFPDIVGNAKIQYTNPYGGMGSTKLNSLGEFRKSNNEAGNAGIGGNPAQWKSDSKGTVAVEADGAVDSAQGTGSQMTTLGFNIGGGLGKSDVEYNLMDINGDGLPDLVRLNESDGQKSLKVRYNLGYSFTEEEQWNSTVINYGESKSLNLGLNIGFNSGDYGWGGGLSGGGSESYSKQTLSDVNGDGLVDRVNNDGTVWINTGSGFASSSYKLGGPAEIGKGRTYNFGGGGYFTISIPIVPPITVFNIVINPGADIHWSMNRQEIMLSDVDGDGCTDRLLSDDTHPLTVWHNKTGKTNLLRTVSRPLGASFELEYTRDGNTYENPNSRWNLTKVTVNDGVQDGIEGKGADTQIKEFVYQGGRYDRFERDFYGYKRVSETVKDTMVSGSPDFRLVNRGYLNTTYHNKGLLLSEKTYDMSGAVQRQLMESANTYGLELVADSAGHEITYTADILIDSVINRESAFPKLERTNKTFYEDSSAGISTYQTFDYDRYGNVTSFFDAGDIGGGDNVMAVIKYTGDGTGRHSGLADAHIVGLPESIVVINNSGNVLRKREADYSADGDLTTIRQYLTDNTFAQSSLTYYTNGNLKDFKGPANKDGQRYTLNYDYDADVSTHVTSISDSFNYSSDAAYDYRFGRVKTTTDLNGNIMENGYDKFGRLVYVIGPFEAGTTKKTIEFEYHPEADVPYALTKHYDPYRDAAGVDTIDTLLFTDGLKRVLQTKKDASIFTAEGTAPQDSMIVSGRVVFDHVGRTIEQYYPVTEAKGSNDYFNETRDTQLPTLMVYDALDRNIKTTIPDGTFTTISYGIAPEGGQDRFKTTVTDAENNKKETFRDVRELITSVKEYNTTKGEVITTLYGYDSLKQIVSVIDAQSNTTTVEYDMLGRRTAITNPDTGRVQTVYDLASNVIEKITPNLALGSKKIEYGYDYNRLMTITYPDCTSNTVTYTYGAASLKGQDGNLVGRITKVTFESGSETREYDKLGQVVKEVYNLNTDNKKANGTLKYTTEYEFDSWGRMQKVKYPDKEEVMYGYDAGGLLNVVNGRNTSVEYPYVQDIQ